MAAPCSSNRRRFNANDPKYRCSCCHSRTGAMLVGGMEIILFCLFAICAVVWFVHDGYVNAHNRRKAAGRVSKDDQAATDNATSSSNEHQFEVRTESIIWLALSLAVCLICILAVAVLFVAVVRERPCLLWLYMICRVALLLGLVAWMVYLIVQIVPIVDRLIHERWLNDDDRHKWLRQLILPGLQLAGCLVGLVAFSAFLVIVRRCYRYFRDWQQHERKLRTDDKEALKRLRV